MGSSKARGSTDSSATESDGSTTETDSDIHNLHNEESTPPPCPFSENEKVLAYHNVQIYEAKVLQIEFQVNRWEFFVHYLGWNKSWDEWVGEDRLMKYTEENLKIQKNLNMKRTDQSAKLAHRSHIKPKSPNVLRGKKRKNDSVAKDRGAIPTDNLVSIQIPPILKKQLVDDCEFITHLGKLVKLPRNPSVEDILKKYEQYRLKKDGFIAESVEEVLKGLRAYFDKVLPVMLLYKSERQQYEEAVIDGVSPSTVYGAEHLLRLFVKLPELLYYAKIEEETSMELQQKLTDFLKFLQKNQRAFFLYVYDVPEDMETIRNKQDD